MCVFFIFPENKWERRLFQGSPELFSPSVMRKREELWGRDWYIYGDNPVKATVRRRNENSVTRSCKTPFCRNLQSVSTSFTAIANPCQGPIRWSLHLPHKPLGSTLSRVHLWIERFPKEVSRANRGKSQWNRQNDSRQQAHSCDSSALQKKMVLFITLLGKQLTQEINADGSSIWWAPVHAI